MSEETIKLLNRRIEEQAAQIATLGAEAKDRRIKGKRLTDELEKLKAEHILTAKERDDFRAKAEASPGEHAATIKDLQSKLRARGVADKFADHAKELADGVTLDKLFKAAGFDPTSEEAEKADPAELVKGLKTSDPYLFKPAGSTPAAAPGGAQRPALQTQTPTGRGDPVTAGSQFKVRAADVNDANWMRANQANLSAAQAAGTVVWVD